MLAFLLACAPQDGSPPPGGEPPTPTPSTTPTPVTSSTNGPLSSIALESGPPAAPATARLVVSFERPMSVDVDATDGPHELHLHRDAALDHDIPLIGLYADAHWTVTPTATDAAGAWKLPVQTLDTPPLPSPFPQVAVRTALPAQMAPGWTLLAVSSVDVAGYLVAFDAEGAPAWWYVASAPRILEATLTPRGTILLMWDEKELREIDWFGATIRSVTALDAEVQTTPVPVSDFHHELFEDDQGRWITLTHEIRSFADFPSSYDSPIPRTTANVNVEPLLALDPDDGAILERWDPWEAVDPERIGFDSLNVDDGGEEWVHTNSVADAGDDWLVSFRHQDAVVKVGKDGTLRWILGNPDNWGSAWQSALLTPTGPLQWPYHQHAAKWSADGRVLAFDNGNWEASPWVGQVQLTAEQSVSRLVEYQVDETAHTVAQTLSFSLDPPVFSPSRGDADWLDGGNVLGCWAYAQYEGGVANEDLGRTGTSMRVAEVAPDGTAVFDLDLWAGPDEAGGWFGYRAERVVPPR